MAGDLKDPIQASTRFCAVFGFPIKHSASPAMQNAALSELKLNWRYLAFAVRPEELREAILGAARMGFIGLNLTVPHKLLALEMMDCLDESARRWGAVNTVRFEGWASDGWKPVGQFQEPPEKVRAHGFNTDADAIVRSIQEDLKIPVRGSSLLLLGAGGAGRVAALRFAAEGCRQLFLVNRTQSKAEEIAAEIRALQPEVQVKVGYPDEKIDLLVNATSLGLREGDGLPFDPARFTINQARGVYDMIYRPAQTRLLQEAMWAGCATANGLGMLLYQGAQALEIWTGQKAPLATMRTALHQAIYG